MEMLTRTPEKNPLQLEFVTIAKDGLGYGAGPISRMKIEGAAEDPQGLARATDEAMRDEEHILTPVEVGADGKPLQGDGCSDGRGLGLVFRRVGGRIETLPDLARPKEFGGGLVMTLAARIGLGLAGVKTFDEAITDAIGALREAGCTYGAHTADGVQPPNCGCGALDKMPQVMAAAGTFEKDIRGSIRTLTTALGMYDEKDAAALDSIFANFARAAQANQDVDYSGQEAMERILDDGKVVKQLSGPHRETRILVNTVVGWTINQRWVREQTGGRADIFAIDLWRMAQHADMYGSAAEKRAALLSGLVYTLATAAVLTQGDLPVVAITEANDGYRPAAA